MPQLYDIKKDLSYKKGVIAGKEEIQRKTIKRILLKNLLLDYQIVEFLEVPLSLIQEIRTALIKEGRLKEA